MTVKITNVEIPDRIDKQTERAMKKAASKAGATALRDMRSETSKRVRTRKRIKAKSVRDALRLRRQTSGPIDKMSWALDVADTAVRAADYPHRQTRKGVSVAINKGKRSLIKDAFLAKMASGHKGVFKRVGQARLPIAEQLASRVMDALLHAGEIPAIQERGQRAFTDTFARVLPLELEKTKKL